MLGCRYQVLELLNFHKINPIEKYAIKSHLIYSLRNPVPRMLCILSSCRFRKLGTNSVIVLSKVRDIAVCVVVISANRGPGGQSYRTFGGIRRRTTQLRVNRQVGHRIYRCKRDSRAIKSPNRFGAID